MPDEFPKGAFPTNVIFDDNERSLCFVYHEKSTPALDTKPLAILCGCICPKPKENYPFVDEVFEYIHKIAPAILKYSAKYDVPPIAVAGGIADEYNTRYNPNNAGKPKPLIDLLQDKVYPNLGAPYINERGIPFCVQVTDGIGASGLTYCEYFPWVEAGLDKTWLDRKIQEQYDEIVKRDPDNLGNKWRYVYMLAGGDFGKGNISMRTAIDLYDDSKKNDPNELADMTRAELMAYLVTDDGTANFAALMIRAGKKLMAKSLAGLPLRKQEAVLVSYFKQGAKYYTGPKGFLNKRGKNPANKIWAGEGCGVCYQRARFGKELGVPAPVIEERK
jgi:hypothetical protein